jgi:hypothetical protein
MPKLISNFSRKRRRRAAANIHNPEHFADYIQTTREFTRLIREHVECDQSDLPPDAPPLRERLSILLDLWSVEPWDGRIPE